jgi:hypothetical protein
MQYIDKYWVIQNFTTIKQIAVNKEGFTQSDMEYIKKTNELSRYLAINAEKRKKEIILSQRNKWSIYD